MKLEYLIKIIMQDKPSIAIRENEEEILKMIPELKLCKNFNQNNKWHIYDVYEHIIRVVDGVPNDLILRLAALFHDVGKPEVYTEDEQGIGHFYGHWNKSKEIFESFALNYGLGKRETDLISKLILYHDLNIEENNDDVLYKIIDNFDIDGIRKLFKLKKSDLLAQNSQFHYLLDTYDKQLERILEIKKVDF